MCKKKVFYVFIIILLVLHCRCLLANNYGNLDAEDTNIQNYELLGNACYKRAYREANTDDEKKINIYYFVAAKKLSDAREFFQIYKNKVADDEKKLLFQDIISEAESYLDYCEPEMAMNLLTKTQNILN